MIEPSPTLSTYFLRTSVFNHVNGSSAPTTKTTVFIDFLAEVFRQNSPFSSVP